MPLRVDGLAGRQRSNTASEGMKPYMSNGERKAPVTLPYTTETMAAASSPPEARVMTTLEAMVVGRHEVVSIPMMTATEGVPLSRAPAASEM